MATPPEPVPPFGSKRAAALAIYTPPFRFVHGYIYDASSRMVADQGGFDGAADTVAGAVAARVRGWGRIGYMPDAEALQDEVGAVIAEALTAFWHAAEEQSRPTTSPNKTTAAALAPSVPSPQQDRSGQA